MIVYYVLHAELNRFDNEFNLMKKLAYLDMRTLVIKSPINQLLKSDDYNVIYIVFFFNIFIILIMKIVAVIDEVY